MAPHTWWFRETPVPAVRQSVATRSVEQSIATYSTLMPAVLTTLDHLARSSLMNCASCSGVDGHTSAPSVSKRSLTASDLSVLTRAALSFATIPPGVFAGARMPVKVLASAPVTPDSASVGRSGRVLDRVGPAKANARVLPLLMNAIAALNW